MAANAPQLVNVVCPSCRTQYSASVQSIVDVGQDPRLKSLLLQGRINVGVCPNCGTAGMLSVPLLYHDPEKELLFILVPQELRMNEGERQRLIGQMSRAIMNSLPPEQRKGYLLQPRMFISFPSLIETILEADGITREMLQAQQEKLEVIGQMLDVLDDSLALSALIGQHEAQIDYEFFALLSLQISAAEQVAQSTVQDRLVRLREILLQRTAAGQKVAQEQEAIEKVLQNIDEHTTRQDLLERILSIPPEHKDQVLPILVTMARSLLDYEFFQLLTVRIDQAVEQGETERAQDLREVRDQVLEVTQELDVQLRLEIQDRAQLLSEILSSSDPKATIRTHLPEIDDVFMSMLAANMAQVEQRQPDLLGRLQTVRNQIAEVLQESAPPELRFISGLMSADYPNDTRSMLAANPAKITPQVLGMMEALASELDTREDMEASEKLRGILAQAKLMSTV